MKFFQFLFAIFIFIMGFFNFFLWKPFAEHISKYKFVTYGKAQEIGIKICFYLIGGVFILAGIKLLIEYFKVKWNQAEARIENKKKWETAFSNSYLLIGDVLNYHNYY